MTSIKRDKTYSITNVGRSDTGRAALAVGGGGLVLYGVAALLPFVNILMLLVAAVVYGVIKTR